MQILMEIPISELQHFGVDTKTSKTEYLVLSYVCHGAHHERFALHSLVTPNKGCFYNDFPCIHLYDYFEISEIENKCCLEVQ